MVENVRQKAPFTLVDGAWLQNVLNTGPCNQVQANLFAIWADEAGNGRTELNHRKSMVRLIEARKMDPIFWSTCCCSTASSPTSASPTPSSR